MDTRAAKKYFSQVKALVVKHCSYEIPVWYFNYAMIYKRTFH